MGAFEVLEMNVKIIHHVYAFKLQRTCNAVLVKSVCQNIKINHIIYIYIYVCVCVCVCENNKEHK